MTKKELAKRYVISAVIMLFALFLVSSLLLFSLAYSGYVNMEYYQLLLIALAVSLVPCGSFTGFVIVFTKIKTMTRFWKIALCILFPITLSVITVLGIASFLPYLVYSIIVLVK